MLFAMLLFSVMGACIKLAGAQYHFFELVAYRGLIGTLLLAAVARWQGGSWGSLRTPVPGMHVSRCVIGVTSLCLWFYSFGGLPLPTAVTLNATAPIWVAAILMSAGLVMAPHTNAHTDDLGFNTKLALAIVVSFVGVALLLKPTLSRDQLSYGLIGLLSGVISAFAYLQVSAIGRAGEPEYRVVFYFSLASCIIGFIGSVWLGFHAHTPKGLWLLLAIGISASLAQMAMTRAYTFGNTLVTANLQYSGILFSTLLGWWLFDDVLDAYGGLGVVLIIASGVAATLYRARNVSAPATVME
jgi:S-adenosylmethionine uptake transporter